MFQNSTVLYETVYALENGRELQTEMLKSFTLDRQRNVIKQVTLVVFVRCTEKFLSFFMNESSNYRARNDCRWKQMKMLLKLINSELLN